MVGGHYVRAIAFDDSESVAYLLDMQPSVALHEMGQDALMVGREVLNEHECHLGLHLCRHGREKGFVWGESPGRSSDADNRKILVMNGPGIGWTFCDRPDGYRF